jgi:hypothetical protein
MTVGVTLEVGMGVAELVESVTSVLSEKGRVRSK